MTRGFSPVVAPLEMRVDTAGSRNYEPIRFEVAANTRTIDKVTVLREPSGSSETQRCGEHSAPLPSGIWSGRRPTFTTEGWRTCAR
jgi:hypothetical protein